MNQNEVKKLLAVIAARYPNSKVWGDTDEQAHLTVQAWHMTLDDVALGDAQRVLVTWFKTEKWAPDPSEIRALLAEKVAPVESEGEAWDQGLWWIRNRGEVVTFGAEVMSRLGKPRDLGLMEVSKLREMFGYEYRRVADAERTERTAALPSLLYGEAEETHEEPALPGLRAIS